MSSASALRAYHAYASDRWDALVAAHSLLVRGQVHSGLRSFRDVLPSLPYLLGGEPHAWPPFSASPHDASVSSALVYLRDFFQLTKTWKLLPTFIGPIKNAPEYPALPAAIRAQIEAGYGLSQAGSLPHDDIISGMQHLLSEVASDASPDGQWARIVLQLALSEANNRALRSTMAIHHAQAALALTPPGTPYYAIRAYEEIANAHYDAATINDDDDDQYDHALDAYNRADAIVDQIGPEAWPMSRDYDKGWLFCRRNDFALAVEHFERAALRRSGAGLLYDAGRSYYGMGYALLNLDRHDAARASLHRALDLFSDDDHEQLNQDALGLGSRSPLMLGRALQILGLVDQDQGDFKSALDNLELSREHLLAVTDPGPWFDTLVPLIEVCRALNRPDKLAYYESELAALRTRFDLPKS